MTSIPYSIEINDIPAVLDGKQSGESFGRMIKDQFDVLYEEGAKSGRVMSICLHPFIIGHPFAAASILMMRYGSISGRARRESGSRREAEIVDAYRAPTMG